MLIRSIIAVSLSLSVCACSMPKLSMPKFSMPRVYKVTVQQGNVITQEMIDQLKPGMTRSQVAFIMGEPILRHTFDAGRWDYIYTVEMPGYFNQEVRMSLFFKDDVLAYFTGDLAPTAASEDGETAEVSDATEAT